jgi:hypothetical protein
VKASKKSGFRKLRVLEVAQVGEYPYWMKVTWILTPPVTPPAELRSV